MPITLEKTWQFNVNQDMNSTGNYFTTRQNLLWAIKESLIGFASSPWVVVGSSDGASGGMDGVDRWTAPNKLDWSNNGSTHSWIVLEQPGMSGAQLMFSCNFSNADLLDARFSPQGLFTGGSNIQDPTADDFVYLCEGRKWFDGYTLSAFSCALHVMMSTDGKHTRIIMPWLGDRIGGLAFIEEVADPQAGWPTPFLCGWYGDEDIYKMRYVDLLQFKEHFDGPLDANVGGRVTFSFATEGFHNASIKRATEEFTINDISGEHHLMPIYLVSETAGGQGLYGRLVDLWFGEAGITHGDTYPADGSMQLAQFHALVYPWTGPDAPLLT